jgi:hypothetical protein
MPSACPRCGRPVAPSAGRCPHCDAALAGPGLPGPADPSGAALAGPALPGPADPSGAALAGGGFRVSLSTPRPADMPAAKPPPLPPTTAQRTAEGLVEGTRTGVRVGTRVFRRLSRRAKIIVIAVVVALVVGVPATLWVVGRVAYAPEEPVEDLVAAFDDGDLARVATLARCTSARLCSPAALADGYEPPRDVTIDNVAMGGSTSPDTADIRIRYTLRDEQRTSIIRVRRGGGLTPQEWSIESGLTGTLEIAAAGLTSVTVGGIEVNVPAAGRTPLRETALIGAYTVRAAPGNRLYEASEEVAVVTDDLRTRKLPPVALEPTVRPAILDAAKRQIQEFLDACERSPDYAPKVGGRECPFAHKFPLPDMSTPARWTYDPAPEFDVIPPDEPTKEPQLTVRTTKPGRATVNYTSRNKPETHTYEVTVGGTVTVGDNDSITWTD